MADSKKTSLKKLQELEKRLTDLENYVYNLDDFLPARSLIEKAMNFIEKKERVGAADLVKRFRITDIRAQKLVDLFVDYEMLAKDADEDGFRKINKEAFGIYKPQPIEHGENDPLIPKVVENLKEFDFLSASLIQRKFRLGYARAAKILDQLEALGYLSPAEGSKPREVLKK